MRQCLIHLHRLIVESYDENNQRPTWLDLAHRKLDEAILGAYGRDDALCDEVILERLLALNLERTGE